MKRSAVLNDLRRARYALMAANRLENKIAELDALRTTITPSYSDMPKGGSGNKIEDLTAKIMELEQQQAEEIFNYLTEYRRVESMIMLVDAHDIRLANVLRARYIDGLRWEQIAVDMNYTYQSVWRMHNKAVDFLASVL